MVAAPAAPERFDEWDPANVSPLVAWLATDACEVTGRIFYVFAGEVAPMAGWSKGPGVSRSERWTVPDIVRDLPTVL
jgi:hypothetical protein